MPAAPIVALCLPRSFLTIRAPFAPLKASPPSGLLRNPKAVPIPFALFIFTRSAVARSAATSCETQQRQLKTTHREQTAPESNSSAIPVTNSEASHHLNATPTQFQHESRWRRWWWWWEAFLRIRAACRGGFFSLAIFHSSANPIYRLYVWVVVLRGVGEIRDFGIYHVYGQHMYGNAFAKGVTVMQLTLLPLPAPWPLAAPDGDQHYESATTLLQKRGKLFF